MYYNLNHNNDVNNVSKYEIQQDVIIITELFEKGDIIHIQSCDPINERPQVVFYNKKAIGTISSDFYRSLHESKVIKECVNNDSNGKGMYNIKFKCKELTGDTVHSIVIHDTSLSDTWDVITIGEISDKLKEINCNHTHDLNVWIDTNDDGRNQLYLSIYPLINDPESSDQQPSRSYDHSISCEIVDVDSSEFTNKGAEYFYLVGTKIKVQMTAKVVTYITMEVEVDDTKENTLEEAMNDVLNECHYEYTHDSIVETEMVGQEFLMHSVI